MSGSFDLLIFKLYFVYTKYVNVFKMLLTRPKIFDQDNNLFHLVIRVSTFIDLSCTSTVIPANHIHWPLSCGQLVE